MPDSSPRPTGGAAKATSASAIPPGRARRGRRPGARPRLSGGKAWMEIYGIAARRHGIVTTADVRPVGISPATLRTLAYRRQLVHVSQGVYRLQGSPFNGYTRLMALARWPQRVTGILTGDCAAWLHIRADDSDDDRELDLYGVDLIVPPSFRTHRTPPSALALYREALAPDALMTKRPFIVTRPLITLRYCAYVAALKAAATPRNAAAFRVELQRWIDGMLDRRLIAESAATSVWTNYEDALSVARATGEASSRGRSHSAA